MAEIDLAPPNIAFGHDPGNTKSRRDSLILGWWSAVPDLYRFEQFEDCNQNKEPTGACDGFSPIGNTSLRLATERENHRDSRPKESTQPLQQDQDRQYVRSKSTDASIDRIFTVTPNLPVEDPLGQDPPEPSEALSHPDGQPESRAQSMSLDSDDDPESFECWEHGCEGRKFATASNLRRHKRERSRARQAWLCPRCGASFSRSTARNQHAKNRSCPRRRIRKRRDDHGDVQVTLDQANGVEKSVGKQRQRAVVTREMLIRNLNDTLEALEKTGR